MKDTVADVFLCPGRLSVSRQAFRATPLRMVRFLFDQWPGEERRQSFLRIRPISHVFVVSPKSRPLLSSSG